MRNDTFKHRLKYFISSMNKVYKIKNIQSLAMAEHITGTKQWKIYLGLIEKFV